MTNGFDLPIPAQFSRKFAVNEVVVLLMSGAEPIIGYYVEHDMVSVTLKDPCNIGFNQDPRSGKMQVGLMPYGAPFIKPRKGNRKFAFSTIIQTDVCAEAGIADAYRKMTSGIQPAGINALNELDKRLG